MQKLKSEENALGLVQIIPNRTKEEQDRVTKELLDSIAKDRHTYGGTPNRSRQFGSMIGKNIGLILSGVAIVLAIAAICYFYVLSHSQPRYELSSDGRSRIETTTGKVEDYRGAARGWVERP